MDERFEAALIECLDALEQGDPIDLVLARYPEWAAELRPMLETAVTLPQLNVQPSLAAQRRSRDTFLSQAAALKESKTTRPSFWFNLRRALMPIAALALVVIIFAAGLGPLSAGALPGDALYGSKILVENARTAFTINPAADAALTEQFNQRRIQEITALLAQNRTADVAFTGQIEALQPGLWTISGLPTEIDDTTQILGGDPLIDQMADVNGRTQNGRLIATTITLQPVEQQPIVEPTPTIMPSAVPEQLTETAIPTATQTYTPAPTETSTPEPTLTATPTQTPEPTATITPWPTATATAPPPAATVPSDDGGSNDNDNDNDDDDDNSNDDNSNDDNSNDTDNDDDDNSNDDDDDDDDDDNSNNDDDDDD